MRRIEGIAVLGGDGPVRSGFLRLGDVTVLTGANDSGKTRLMQFVERSLVTPDRAVDYVDVFGLVRCF